MPQQLANELIGFKKVLISHNPPLKSKNIKTDIHEKREFKLVTDCFSCFWIKG